MKNASVEITLALAVLERRGFVFRRSGSRYLTTCRVGNHNHPERKLAIFSMNGTVRVGCFACGFNDSLPRFLCRLDGKDPVGLAWAEAMRECGVDILRNPGMHRPSARVWSERLEGHMADLPLFLARSPEELEAFIIGEINHGTPRESPYMQKMIAGLRWMRVISRAGGAA